ncbi:hypothetical protein [Bradyrhizobium sp. 192]|uniref:hypothetical protein n=1 Tax=Bradyrhizobium sp. 192 TaxID=2782660 RepID=UPI001FFE7105|nr:hypothetical protein [Bradyrhizobium sp. 192]UPJ55810.1 hypothetical protein IVB24_24540 [Bradyrhizobium sp. 192]
MSPGDVTMPVWNEKHLRAAPRAAGVALWSWNVDTDAITMDEAAYELWDLGGTIAFDWSDEGVVVALRMSKNSLAL